MPEPLDFLIRALNHLLDQEAWARQRLQAYSGLSVRVAGGPLEATITVDENGMLRPATSDESPSVTIEFDADALFKLLSDPGSLFNSAHVSGVASFAETLAFVSRNLRWDFEADLAGVVGDIPARRIALAAASGLAWHRSVARNIGANVAEYATEEAGLVVPVREVSEFTVAVDQLRDDLARLEKRIARLTT